MKRKVKITRFDIFIMFLIAYSGLGFGIYSLIRRSTYTTTLIHSFIQVILWIVFVVAVHIAVKKQRQNSHEDN